MTLTDIVRGVVDGVKVGFDPIGAFLSGADKEMNYFYTIGGSGAYSCPDNDYGRGNAPSGYKEFRHTAAGIFLYSVVVATLSKKYPILKESLIANLLPLCPYIALGLDTVVNVVNKVSRRSPRHGH